MFEDLQDMTREDLNKKREELEKRMSKIIEMMANLTNDPDLLLQDAYCKLNDNMQIIINKTINKGLTSKQTSELTNIFIQFKNILKDYLEKENLKGE